MVHDEENKCDYVSFQNALAGFHMKNFGNFLTPLREFLKNKEIEHPFEMGIRPIRGVIKTFRVRQYSKTKLVRATIVKIDHEKTHIKWKKEHGTLDGKENIDQCVYSFPSTNICHFKEFVRILEQMEGLWSLDDVLIEENTKTKQIHMSSTEWFQFSVSTKEFQNSKHTVRVDAFNQDLYFITAESSIGKLEAWVNKEINCAIRSRIKKKEWQKLFEISLNTIQRNTKYHHMETSTRKLLAE